MPGAGGAGGAGGPLRDKVIVFSQWTSMLDLLEVPLKAARYPFRRLDGTMSVAQREKAVMDFEGRPEVFVLLVSLKAAALGVNLVAANHVVLMDLWWNPTQEAQAIDRAHRIGQTREVRRWEGNGNTACICALSCLLQMNFRVCIGVCAPFQNAPLQGACRVPSKVPFYNRTFDDIDCWRSCALPNGSG